MFASCCVKGKPFGTIWLISKLLACSFPDDQSLLCCSIAWLEQGKVDVGESWLQHLKSHEYDELSFEQRVNILWTLMNLALDGPTVRAALEGRTEEAQRIRKQMWEEARVTTSNPVVHCCHAHLTLACAGCALAGSGLCFTLLVACVVVLLSRS